jgi:hypothetical protein
MSAENSCFLKSLLTLRVGQNPVQGISIETVGGIVLQSEGLPTNAKSLVVNMLALKYPAVKEALKGHLTLGSGVLIPS